MEKSKEICYGQHDIMVCDSCALIEAVNNGIIHERNEQMIRTIRQIVRELK